MKQTATQCFESECGKAKLYVDNDLALGVFHDFLMNLKGWSVDRMVEAHKEDKKASEEQIEIDDETKED